VKGGGKVVVLLLTQMGELREHEASLVDLTNIQEGIESVVECIHKVAMEELFVRNLKTMWDWEVRTKNMFKDNHLYKVGDVAMLPTGKVNRLIGCGYTTRKEVYDVFWTYHIRLKFWAPDKHYSKMNYRFS
jgi:hypothetical protein